MTGALEFIDFCRPVLTRVCGYWCARRAGAEPSAEQVRRELRSDFAVLKRRAAEDERSLEICEAVVEPLIFFVDYTLKEGSFSFSGAWREMAREFNELSGDEKFFDYLEELRRPAQKGDADDENLRKAAFYFLLLGLGFDGMHRTERLKTLGLMEHLSRGLPPTLTDFPERWTPEPRPVGGTAGRKSLPDFLVSSDFALIALVCATLFALAALFYNVQVLRSETAGFSRTIEAALEATGLQNAAVSAPMQGEGPGEEPSAAPEPAAAPEKLPLLPKLTEPEPAPQGDGSVLRIN